MVEKTNKNDSELIRKFFAWGILNNFNLARLAYIVGASRGWASIANQGKIKTLHPLRREKIKALLGIQE